MIGYTGDLKYQATMPAEEGIIKQMRSAFKKNFKVILRMLLDKNHVCVCLKRSEFSVIIVLMQ